MAQELKKVERGELIESELMNLIIDQLIALNDAVGDRGTTGSVTVPNLFGRTLSSAQSLISEPQAKLKLGNTVDAYGALLNPGIAETKQKIVIGQVPPPGTRVAVNSAVDVLLSVKPSTGTGPTPTTVPKITGFNPAKTPVGEKVTIFGENFDIDLAKNKVFFADTPIAAPPEKGGTTELLVRVPAIPEPPTGNSEKKISVRVETLGGKGTGDTTLLPALAGDPPELTSIKGADPDMLLVGEIATIVGKNFSTKIQENSVLFGSIATGIETTGNSTTTLKVRVPDLPGLSSGQFRFVDIAVVVAGRQSNLIKSKEVDKA